MEKNVALKENSFHINKNECVEKRRWIAERIDYELRVKNISKNEFAVMMKRKPPQISKWLSGKHNFTVDVLCEIEHRLKINILHTPPKTENLILNRFTENHLSIHKRDIPEIILREEDRVANSVNY